MVASYLGIALLARPKQCDFWNSVAIGRFKQWRKKKRRD